MFTPTSPLVHAIVLCGYIIGGLTLLIMWGSLFGDARRRKRSGGHPRCPKCGYNMFGLSERRCPECGHIAKTDAELLKPRRHWWRFATALMVLAVSGVAVKSPELLSDAWIPATPSFLLISMLGDAAPPSSYNTPPTQDEKYARVLWKRYATDNLSVRQKRRLTARQFLPGQEPLMLSTRSHWPKGTTAYAKLAYNFAGVRPRTLTAKPRDAALQAITLTDMSNYGNDYDGWPYRSVNNDEALIPIGMPQPGLASIVFDATITEQSETVWSGVISTAQLNISGSVDDVLNRESDAEALAFVERDLTESVYLSEDRTWIMLMPKTKTSTHLLTVGAQIDVLLEAEVVAHADAVWTYTGSPTDSCSLGGTPASSYEGRSEGNCEVWRMLSGDLVRLKSAEAEDPRWTIRFRGDGALALLDFTASKYWAGEVTIPLKAAKRP